MYTKFQMIIAFCTVRAEEERDGLGGVHRELGFKLDFFIWVVSLWLFYYFYYMNIYDLLQTK